MPVIREELIREYNPEEHEKFNYSNTETSMVNKTVFGTINKTTVSSTTINMYVVPKGYVFKINSIQHSIKLNAVADAFCISYVYTDALDVSINQNNVISFVQCAFNSEQICNLSLNVPYIVLEGQEIKFITQTYENVVSCNTIVSLMGILIPINS